MAGHENQNVLNRIRTLREREKEQLDLVRKILRADSGNMFGVDFVVVAAIHRSLALIDGFTVMVERNNPLCGLSLLRLQLDSVMRLFACSLVQDQNALSLVLLEDRPLGKVKTRDGRPMTDRLLHERLSRLYPWASAVYENTSGFIHLSRRHMVAPVSDVDSQSRSVTFEVGLKRVHWPEDKIIEALEAFAATTDALLDLSRQWLQAKVDGRRQRRKEEGFPPPSL